MPQNKYWVQKFQKKIFKEKKIKKYENKKHFCYFYVYNNNDLLKVALVIFNQKLIENFDKLFSRTKRKNVV